MDLRVAVLLLACVIAVVVSQPADKKNVKRVDKKQAVVTTGSPADIKMTSSAYTEKPAKCKPGANGCKSKKKLGKRSKKSRKLTTSKPKA